MFPDSVGHCLRQGCRLCFLIDLLVFVPGPKKRTVCVAAPPCVTWQLVDGAEIASAEHVSDERFNTIERTELMTLNLNGTKIQFAFALRREAGTLEKSATRLIQPLLLYV